MRGLIWMALFAGVLGAGVAAGAGERGGSLVGRWQAELPGGEHRELVLQADGRFAETRASARRTMDGATRVGFGVVVLAERSWRDEGAALTLQAGSQPERRAIERFPGGERIRLDGVVFERRR